MKLVIKILIALIKVFLSFNPSYHYYDYKIELEDIFSQKENRYEVLFYLENCHSCQTIFDYIKRAKIYQKVSVYYIDILNLNDINREYQNDNVGYTNYVDVKIMNSPTLITINQKKVVNQVEGLTLIHLYFEENYNF